MNSYYYNHPEKLSYKMKIEMIDDILTSYTNDEVGLSEKDKYLQMEDEEKVYLFDSSLENCLDVDDFQTTVVIRFDYNCY